MRTPSGSAIRISTTPTAPAAACGSPVLRRQQPLVLELHVANLNPDRQGAPLWISRPSTDLEKTVSQEEHQARRITTPELSVDRQAQRVQIKPVALLRFGRMKQDAARKDFHVLHPALEPCTSLAECM